MKRFLFIAGVALVALLGWFLRSHAPHASAAFPSATRESASPTPTRSPSATHGRGRAPSDGSTLADGLNSPNGTIAADLQIVANALEGFRTNFLHTGNPVGDNAEITAALTGNNPLNLALIPANHAAINIHGELCDRWGTPFFFHQLSGTEMEIRSAGPDREFHTADDAVLTP